MSLENPDNAPHETLVTPEASPATPTQETSGDPERHVEGLEETVAGITGTEEETIKNLQKNTEGALTNIEGNSSLSEGEKSFFRKRILDAFTVTKQKILTATRLGLAAVVIATGALGAGEARGDTLLEQPTAEAAAFTKTTTETPKNSQNEETLEASQDNQLQTAIQSPANEGATPAEKVGEVLATITTPVAVVGEMLAKEATNRIGNNPVTQLFGNVGTLTSDGATGGEKGAAAINILKSFSGTAGDIGTLMNIGNTVYKAYQNGENSAEAVIKNIGSAILSIHPATRAVATLYKFISSLSSKQNNLSIAQGTTNSEEK